MKRIKNVSNKEVVDNLKKTLVLNDKAIDYLENVIRKAQDRLEYNPEDEEYKDILEVLKYIQFSLLYLDKSYKESLKKLGGKKWSL